MVNPGQIWESILKSKVKGSQNFGCSSFETIASSRRTFLFFLRNFVIWLRVCLLSLSLSTRVCVCVCLSRRPTKRMLSKINYHSTERTKPSSFASLSLPPDKGIDLPATTFVLPWQSLSQVLRKIQYKFQLQKDYQHEEFPLFVAPFSYHIPVGHICKGWKWCTSSPLFWRERREKNLKLNSYQNNDNEWMNVGAWSDYGEAQGCGRIAGWMVKGGRGRFCIEEC